MSEGRKAVSVTYWYSRKLNRILNSCPEWFPIPEFLVKLGFEKVVCRSAHDVEIWSQKMRDQERRDQENADLERELTEGPVRDRLRKDLIYERDHARNAFNRDFCNRFLSKLDKLEERTRQRLTRGISFQHLEGFEEKKH